MKRGLLILLATICLASAYSQTTDSICPQFHNTTSFETHDSLYYWTARIGSRIKGPVDYNVLSGISVNSTCLYTRDLEGDNVILNQHKRYHDDTTGAAGCDSTFWDVNGYRFLIIDSLHTGFDMLTMDPDSNGLQRIPRGHKTSVRLGTMVNGINAPEKTTVDSLLAIYEYLDDTATFLALNDTSGYQRWNLDNYFRTNAQSSQALYYTMRVNKANALLVINYAIVARRYDHDAYEAGEFLIRIVQRDSNGQWDSRPINDKLFYRVCAPYATGIVAAPWVAGRSSGGYPCAYVYKPWATAAVNLDELIGQDVRIEIYSSDCIYGVDPLYAYLACDYMSPILKSTGCPEASSQAIDTLVAPANLMGYTWYVATRGPEEDSNLLNAEYMEGVHFRQVSPPPYSGYPESYSINTYAAQRDDFVLTEGPQRGQRVIRQTFMCIMTSALDPNKPFKSKLYVNVENHKPTVAMDYTSSCDGSAVFYNLSAAIGDDTLDPSATYWVIYADRAGTEPIDTLYGDTANYHFTFGGIYGLRLYVKASPSGCASSNLYICDIRGPSKVDILLSSRYACVGQEVVVEHSESDNTSYSWKIDGEETTPGSDGRLHLTLPLGQHIVDLHAENRYGCEYNTRDTFWVIDRPHLDVNPPNAMLCPGQSAVITAHNAVSYHWQARPDDPRLANQQGLSSITVIPERTTLYILKADTSSVCQRSDVGVQIEVEPYPIPTIEANRRTLSFDRPDVTVSDLSPHRDHTHWYFSDGTEDEGVVVAHTFLSLPLDSVSIRMVTCNSANCCLDDTLYIPLDLDALWFPNVFTPDQPTNNTFGIITCRPLPVYEIHIFNRYGFLVHRNKDPNDHWDGRDLHGRPCPQGAYVYVYTYGYEPNGYTHSGRGTVTLLR